MANKQGKTRHLKETITIVFLYSFLLVTKMWKRKKVFFAQISGYKYKNFGCVSKPSQLSLCPLRRHSSKRKAFLCLTRGEQWLLVPSLRKDSAYTKGWNCRGETTQVPAPQSFSGFCQTETSRQVHKSYCAAVDCLF